MKNITECLQKIILDNGIDILGNQRRLNAILADLLPFEKSKRFLVELSLRADIPNKLLKIQNDPIVAYNAKVAQIKEHFRYEFSVEVKVVEDLIQFWLDIIPRNKSITFPNLDTKFDPDNSYKVVTKGGCFYLGNWESGLYGYRKSSGQMITAYKYTYAFPFKEDRARVMIGKNYGFIDKSGQEVIPIRFTNAESFQNGLALVQLNGKYGFVNKDGEFVVPPKFDSAESFSEDMARLSINGKHGYINPLGETVLPFKFFAAHSFQSGLASVVTSELVQGQNRYRVINKEGIIQNFPTSYSPFIFSEELSTIKSGDNGFSCIDLNGKELFSRGYHRWGNFNSGRLIVYNIYLFDDEKWYILNKYGKVINSKPFTKIHNFNESVAFAKLDGRYGLIDIDGNHISSFKYSGAAYPSEIKNGEICVKMYIEFKGEKYGMINKYGQQTIPFEYDKRIEFNEGLACVYNKKKYGFINRFGRLVIPYVYDYYAEFANGLANVSLNAKWGCIDKNGCWVEDL